MRLRLIRPIALSSTLAVLVLLLSQSAMVRAAVDAPTARDRLLALYERRHQEMVSRRLAGLAPLPAPEVVPTVPEDFDRAKGVQQISRDRLPPAPGSQEDTETEPDIAMDPNDSRVVVAVVQQSRFVSGGGAVGIGFSASHNGGRTWRRGTLPGLTPVTGGKFDRATDPAVAFGPDGSVYANTLPFNDSDCRNGIAVNRSDDGGFTWNQPVLVQDDLSCAQFNDKNWMAVDTFPSSPFLGRIYVAWYRSGPIVMRWSDDRGQTWSAMKTVASFGIGVIPVVQPNGDLTMVYDDGGEEVAKTSHDGGVTFEPAVVINSFQGGEPPDMRTGGLPSAAVDPVTGDLYVSWQDGRFHDGGLNDIVVSRSTDGGDTWSALVRANPDPPTSDLDHFTPDVAAFGGSVHLTYRTRDNAGGASRFVEERYVVSADDGQTFGGELVLGPPADLDWAAQAGGYFLGDYMGLTASANSAHAAWCVSSEPANPRSDTHQTTWSGTIVR
jgi:hypothetical protein